MSFLLLVEQAAPDAPATDQVVLYPKSDGRVYSKDDAGTERAISGAVPGVTTDNAVARYDGVAGAFQNSGVTIDDSDSIFIPGASIPQNSQSVAYTLVAADANKHILHPSADTTARTFTIPANSSVAYAIGVAITFVNQNAAGVLTIAITTDTMRLAGPGTTGSRTLAANGIATALKITATEWIISGTGLT